ncbi:hypothetical protein [Micromonospora sp. NBC_01813]|uniref:hypothetical protein n=1 Tax=Micromonospora sp. NBC_01813 TaxID=2975988 RepID=UPI002DD92FC7|nr:hypothetical protein [Micromonospora sp. NBC_01813]WSA08552.1 hypothetical protein OG958_30960 [Micromonospora sp. NBC_01813]
MFARAVPQRVELTETYRVSQEISRNRAVGQDGDGAGLIEVSVPYDGQRYFTQEASSDVAHALPSGPGPDRKATIGHLLLADHHKATRLPAEVSHHTSAGVLPITVPLTDAGAAIDLTGDRQTCEIRYDYQPQYPPIYPVEFTVNVHDLDSLEDELDAAARVADDLDPETVRKVAWDRLKEKWYDNPQQIIDRFHRKISFTNELWLTFALRIVLPVELGPRKLAQLAPEITSMSVQWPTLTSLRSTRLFVKNLESPASEDPHRKAVRYNPVERRLEWDDVPVRYRTPEGSDHDDDADTQMFHSEIAVLHVEHPGDLLKDDVLEVDAEVEIPGYLMSGLRARLYDATGHPHALRLELSTTLKIKATAYLGDIFAGRAFSPYQQFVFDDIIPEEIRITDIETVLRNARFRVEKLPEKPQNEAAPRWLLLARRSQGPDDLELRILVEGRRAQLLRQHKMGDTVVEGAKESGRITVSMLGTLHRDHKEITRVMNAVQQEIRDRFIYHQLSRPKAAES